MRDAHDAHERRARGAAASHRAEPAAVTVPRCAASSWPHASRAGRTQNRPMHPRPAPVPCPAPPAAAARPSAVVRGLGRVWALPCSLLGLLAGAVLLAAGGRARRVDGTLEIGLRARQHQVPRPVRDWPYAAITFGHVILGQSHEALARLRAHERVHVAQYERWGPLFLIAYPLASAWARLRGGDAHADNVFERPALQAEHRSRRRRRSLG